jgi:hypothetical protein
MKLKLLSLSMLFIASIAHAQFTVTDRSGNEIHDGDIVEYGTTEFPASSLEFFVTNDSSEEIYTRIEYVDAINSTNGIFAELCYGLCYFDIAEGSTVPPNSPDTINLLPGETTLEGNHFWGGDPGNGTDNVDFVFTFHQYEADGVTETGQQLTFTYRYNPTLGVQDNNKVNLTIQSTVISNELVLNVKEPVSLVVYNMEGKMVKQANLQTGTQRVNMANLSPQAYIAQFKNDKGAIQTTKLIVQ